jgi:hypothetical protein
MVPVLFYNTGEPVRKRRCDLLLFSLKSSGSCMFFMSQLSRKKYETEDDRMNKLTRAQHKNKIDDSSEKFCDL